MDANKMFNELVKDGLELVDTTDISDQYSNLDVEFGTTILQKERTKRNLENTHKNLNNEIKRIDRNNRELSNTIEEYKKEIDSIF